MHLIKVEDIRGDEVYARHIVALLKVDADDEAETVKFLEGLRSDILTGKITFADAAKKYSDDVSTKELGGQTKWLTVGDESLPASFAAQAEKLGKDEISAPFKSEFKAYHIMKLDDHRNAHFPNIRDDRAILESSVRQKKIIAEFERIFKELRAETYIDIRYE